MEEAKFSTGVPFIASNAVLTLIGEKFLMAETNSAGSLSPSITQRTLFSIAEANSLNRIHF